MHDPLRTTAAKLWGVARFGAVDLMAPRLVALFLSVLFIFTILILTINIYVDPHSYTVLDWAISYAGGFVRRGLSGEIFYFLHQFSGVVFLHQIFITKLVLYAIFFLSVWGVLRNAGFPSAATLLIYSPFFLAFQVADYAAAGRKEILFLAAFAVLCWFVSRPDTQVRSSRALLLFMLLAPIMILAHEALFFFLFWVFVLALVIGLDFTFLRTLVLALVPALLTMLAIVSFPATQETINAICDNLQGVLGTAKLEGECAQRRNAVTWLLFDSSEGLRFVRTNLVQKLPTLMPALLLIGLAYLPFRERFTQWPAVVRARLIWGGIMAVAATLPLFAVAADWGRFAYVNAVSLGLIILVLTARYPSSCRGRSWERLPALLVAVYFLGWHLEHFPGFLGAGIPARYMLLLIPGH